MGVTMKAQQPSASLPGTLTAFLHTLLASFGLPASPILPAGGWSNHVWLAPAHVVRLGSGRFRDALAHEAAVLRLLPTPVPHAAVRAYGRIDGREWLIQDRVPGQPLAQIWSDLDRVQRKAAMKQLGTILRALHAVPLPAGFANPWLDDALTPSGHARDAYHAPPDRAHVLLDAVRAVPGADLPLLDAVGDFLAPQLDAFAGDTPALVHSDVHFANLLWDDGHLTALLDFEGARPASPDLELDTLLRCCREPALFRGHDRPTWPAPTEFAAVPDWLAAGYPELFRHPRLPERLAVYDALWQLVQALNFPPDSGPPDPWGHLRWLLASGRYRL